MTTANQLLPGMTIHLEGGVYRVESNAKVAVPKGSPFIKAKLRNLASDELIEKSFKLDQALQEVNLVERTLEFLYPEGNNYLFLDIGNLDQVLVPMRILGEKIDFLKEGTQVKAMLYGDAVFAIELPQFLEIMITKVDAPASGATTKNAILETGAKLDVPLFIESGDVVKVDTQINGFVQRV